MDSNSKSLAEASHQPVLSHVLKPRLPGMGRRKFQLPSASDTGHSFPSKGSHTQEHK